MSLARRAEIDLTWAGVNITTDVAPYLLGLTYVDNLGGAVDELQIELQDRDGLWSGDWRPTYGDAVVARLQASPWLTDVDDLRLGYFSHDESRHSGPPARLEIGAVAAALATGLRRRKRTRKWARVTLQQIAQDIADRASLALDFTAEAGTSYPRREQREQTDLEFLGGLCRERGLALKVGEGTIAIFDEYDREQTDPVGTIDLTEGHVLSWSFSGVEGERYGACRVSYYNPRTGKLVAGTYTDPAATDGETLEVVRDVHTIGEAEEVARGLLRHANRFATSGTLTVVGDPGLVAGVVFDLENAGGFDGRFIVTRATHRPIGGYTCTLDVRRVLGF